MSEALRAIGKQATLPHFRMLAVLAVALAASLLVLVGAKPAEAAFPGKNGKIAFSRSSSSSNGDIYAMNPDGSVPAKLTKNDNDPNTTFFDSSPAYSPDGNKMAFMRLVCASFCFKGIFVMKADGSDSGNAASVVLSGGFSDDVSSPAWSPDSQKIAYVKKFFDNFSCFCNKYSIRVINADGSNDTLLATGGSSLSSPAWSPDGQTIAFVDTRSGGSDTDIYTMDASNGANKQVLATNTSNQQSPNWSPSGNRVIYSADISFPDGSTDTEIWSAPYPRTGSGFQQLTDNVNEDTDPTYSPDGNKIAFTSNRDGNYEIYVMDANGSNPSRLTNTPENESEPDWQQDSTAPEAPSITSPANNSLDPDGSFAISGTAEAGSTVELFEGTASKGKATADATGKWSMDLSGVADGSHTYTAKATDTAGNASAASNALTVIVDATAPKVDSVTPAESATRVSRSANVTAKFSKKMKPETLTASTVTLLNTRTGSAVIATVSYDEASQTVTLDPTIEKLAKRTKYQAIIKGGDSGAKDVTGNPLAADKVWSFTTKRR